jgi:hypothetical protein
MNSTTGILTPEQILASHGFNFAIPEMLTPGGLAIVSHSTVSKKFDAFLREHSQKKLWYVRGELGREPLFPPCLGVQPTSLLSKTEAQMFVSIIGSRTSSQALSFQPIGNDKGEILAFGLQVEAESPTQALEDAREPFGELLDSLTAWTGAPLRYIQYSIAESEESEPLAFEIHVPFQTQLRFDKGQFLPPLNPLFTLPDAVLREGLCSESPYYRLLCAYRVKDGIDHIRHELGKAAAALGKQQALPELPRISADEIRKRGANIDDGSHEGSKSGTILNLVELFNLWYGKKRNAVAHLFEKDKGKKRGTNPSALFPSVGGAYRDFSSSASILLFYSRSYLNQLKAFKVEHLEPPPPVEIIVSTLRLGQNLRYAGALLMEPENPQRTR